jgi:hypothetical protein
MSQLFKIKIGHGTTFSPELISFYKDIAEKKVRAKITMGMRISNFSAKMNTFEKEFMGIFGEVAFARLLRLEDPTEDCLINNAGYDFSINGKTIDVKTSAYLRAMLTVSTSKKSESIADIFVLMYMRNENTVVFNGACYKEDLIKPENIGKPPGFVTEVYSTRNLKDFEL